MGASKRFALSELGEFRNGLNFNKEQRDSADESDVAVINVKDIFRSGAFLNPSGLDKVKFAPGKFEKSTVEAGDIYFVRSSVKREGVGAVTVARFASSRVVHCGFVIRFRTKHELVDPTYLGVLLSTPQARAQIVAVSGGSAITNVSQSALGQLEFDFPSIERQRSIANLAEVYDDLIENNRRRIEILEEMARLLYREWFVHFRFPGHEDVEMVDSELGPIPEGWRTERLSKLVATQYGYTESTQSDPVGPRYLRGMDMNKSSYIDWSAVPYCPIDESDLAKFKVEVGDVFVIRMADPGKVSICEQEVDAVFASYLVRIRPTVDDLTPYYLFFTLSDDRYQGWVTGASTGSTRKSVSAKVMVEPAIVKPPLEVQDAFVELAAPLRELLTNLLNQNSVLREARDLLLPRLVSGELDVSELDLDGVLV